MKRIVLAMAFACLYFPGAAWAGDAPEESAPAMVRPEKATLRFWDAKSDVDFLSRMIASYESTAFSAQPLVEKSNSVSMQVMANDRVRSMKRFSARIARLMENKGWKPDAAAKKATDERLVTLIKNNNGFQNEMGLLGALLSFHIETAKAALDALEMTADPDVADMARRIVIDQLESIASAKSMPEQIEWEQKVMISDPVIYGLPSDDQNAAKP